MRKKFMLLIAMVALLVGCSTDKDTNLPEVYYSNFPDVLDFGVLTGIEPEISFDQSDESEYYTYNIQQKTEDESFDIFFKKLKSNNYKSIAPQRLMDNGSISNAYENNRYQILTLEFFNTELDFTDKFVISLRPLYLSYKGFPNVPDYGKMNDVLPSETLENNGKTVFIYENSMKVPSYTSALYAHNFKSLGEMVASDDGFLQLYENGEYTILVGMYPTYTSIVISLSE